MASTNKNSLHFCKGVETYKMACVNQRGALIVQSIGGGGLPSCVSP